MTDVNADIEINDPAALAAEIARSLLESAQLGWRVGPVKQHDPVEGIRRRRECLSCAERFTTFERVQTVGLQVVKKDGRREDFSREKLLLGIRRACEKRPLPVGAIEAVVDDIEATLQGQGKAEAPSSLIGELVMGRASGPGEGIAYIRFASIYPRLR